MNITLGFEGQCTRCNNKIKAYYLYADEERRQMMSNDTFMSQHSNCPACVTSSVLQTPQTIRWFRKMGVQEVMKDLETQAGGINIDFAAAEAEMKQNEKNDAFLENQKKRVAEYSHWLKSTDGGIQRRTGR